MWMPELKARLPCRIETRDKIRALKRGSETYDDVLQRLYSEHAGEMKTPERAANGSLGC